MPFEYKYREVVMRKPILIILLLIQATFAFSQTAMALRMSVRRIAVTEIQSDKCEDLRVLLFLQGDILGILTGDDTLQLRRVMIEYTEPGETAVLCYDEFHGNQPYRVAILQGTRGILMYLTPFVPKQEVFLRAYSNVDIVPSTRPLYGLVLSSIPCN